MKAMLLKEAIQEGIVKLGDYVRYKPKKNVVCTISPELTGWHTEQTFRTEELDWTLSNFKGELFLISDDVTEGLWLSGKNGYEHGVESMNRICEMLYSSNLSHKVFAMTKGMIDSGVPYIKSKNCYWLATHSRHNQFGLCVADGDIMRHGCTYDYVMYDLAGFDNNFRFGIRPVVSLEDTVIVSIPEEKRGSKEYPWCFYLDTSSITLKLKIEQLLEEGKKQIAEQQEILAKQEEWFTKLNNFVNEME